MIKKETRDQSIVSYLNSIDFSLVNTDATVDNIYKEITPAISELLRDPFATTSLEKLILLSPASSLLSLLKSIDKRAMFKKLGSRVVEKVYERLFDCAFKESQVFSFEEALWPFNSKGSVREALKEAIQCHNGTFVVRKVLSLVSGKSVDKLRVEKYQISGANKAYGEKVLDEVKRIFKELLVKERLATYSTDFFNTLGTFLLISKSQSLMEWLIENDCDVEAIEAKGFLYELIATIASKKNLALIYSRINGQCTQLALSEKASYFMKAFLRSSAFGKEIYKEIRDCEEIDANSNVILALVESLQRAEEYKLVDRLISKYYAPEGPLFKEFLLDKHGTLDTKFVGVIVNFMNLPKKKGFEHFYRVNTDFVELFEKDWAKTKSGISLLIGYVNGKAEKREKSAFLEKHIDLFWGCTGWKDGRAFMKAVCELTRGHSRKKAYDILRELEKRNDHEK